MVGTTLKRVPGTFSGGKGGRCLGLTTLSPSCADCLEIWEPQPSGTHGPLHACNGIASPLPLEVLTAMLDTWLISHIVCMRWYMCVIKQCFYMVVKKQLVMAISNPD